MPKVPLNDIGTLTNVESARTALNDNFTAIEEAFENTLSRDGLVPNSMDNDLDMDGNHILNLPDPLAETDGVNLRTVRLIAEAVLNGESPAGDLTLRADLSSPEFGGTHVGFKQSHPDAVHRNVRDKLRERISVLDYIPVAEHAAILAGTSTYDSTLAFQRALNETVLQGGELLVSRGKFLVSAELIVDYSSSASNDENNRLVIKGEGKKSTEIALTGTTGAVLRIKGAWPYSTTVSVEGMRLRGNGGTTKGIHASSCAGLNISDVICQGAQYGWDFVDCHSVNLDRASTIFNTYGGRFVRNSLTFPNLYNISGGSVGGNAVWGLEVVGGCNLNMQGCGIEGNGVGQGAGVATSWGIKITDPGHEGGAACSIQGCYFEVNNGQADVWISSADKAVSADISGNSFNRISSTNYTINNVRFSTSSLGKIDATLHGNGYFVAGTYVRSSARRVITGEGLAGTINYEYGGSMGATDVDSPSLLQSGRIGNPVNSIQAWGRFDGASSTVTSQGNIAGYARHSVGTYTVTFGHPLSLAGGYLISLESSVPLGWQIVTETSTSVQFTTRNSAGTLTDPTRIMFAVLG